MSTYLQAIQGFFQAGWAGATPYANALGGHLSSGATQAINGLAYGATGVVNGASYAGAHIGAGLTYAGQGIASGASFSATQIGAGASWAGGHIGPFLSALPGYISWTASNVGNGLYWTATTGAPAALNAGFNALTWTASTLWQATKAVPGAVIATGKGALALYQSFPVQGALFIGSLVLGRSIVDLAMQNEVLQRQSLSTKVTARIFTATILGITTWALGAPLGLGFTAYKLHTLAMILTSAGDAEVRNFIYNELSAIDNKGQCTEGMPNQVLPQSLRLTSPLNEIFTADTMKGILEAYIFTDRSDNHQGQLTFLSNRIQWTNGEETLRRRAKDFFDGLNQVRVPADGFIDRTDWQNYCEKTLNSENADLISAFTAASWAHMMERSDSASINLREGGAPAAYVKNNRSVWGFDISGAVAI